MKKKTQPFDQCLCCMHWDSYISGNFEITPSYGVCAVGEFKTVTDVNGNSVKRPTCTHADDYCRDFSPVVLKNRT